MYTVDLSDKEGLVIGVANARSIAWAIADILNQAGTRLAFSCQGERLKSSLEKLTSDCKDPLLVQCDVTNDDELDALFNEVEDAFGSLDFVVHAVAFAPGATFEKPFAQTTREEWNTAMDVSAYSLVAVAQRAEPLRERRLGSKLSGQVGRN